MMKKNIGTRIKITRGAAGRNQKITPRCSWKMTQSQLLFRRAWDRFCSFRPMRPAGQVEKKLDRQQFPDAAPAGAAILKRQ